MSKAYRANVQNSNINLINFPRQIRPNSGDSLGLRSLLGNIAIPSLHHPPTSTLSPSISLPLSSSAASSGSFSTSGATFSTSGAAAGGGQLGLGGLGSVGPPPGLGGPSKQSIS